MSIVDCLPCEMIEDQFQYELELFHEGKGLTGVFCASPALFRTIAGFSLGGEHHSNLSRFLLRWTQCLLQNPAHQKMREGDLNKAFAFFAITEFLVETRCNFPSMRDHITVSVLFRKRL